VICIYIRVRRGESVYVQSAGFFKVTTFINIVSLLAVEFNSLVEKGSCWQGIYVCNRKNKSNEVSDEKKNGIEIRCISGCMVVALLSSVVDGLVETERRNWVRTGGNTRPAQGNSVPYLRSLMAGS
jgi:hypothetical protein